jgi:transcriptional regulator with XRE-family HTH domain
MTSLQKAFRYSGKLIWHSGYAVSFVLEKSGISRSRLVYLRTTKGAEPSLSEAKALAPVFKMTIDKLAEELERIEKEKEESSTMP